MGFDSISVTQTAKELNDATVDFRLEILAGNVEIEGMEVGKEGNKIVVPVDSLLVWSIANAKTIHDRHVTLWDLGENDENFSDDDAEGVTLSVQVTIFSESDEVELAREIKSIMKENDFSFEGRNGDDSKPEDGIYMKAQRFSKFYEMEE